MRVFNNYSLSFVLEPPTSLACETRTACPAEIAMPGNTTSVAVKLIAAIALEGN